MDDARVVGGRQRVGHLPCDGQGLGKGQRSAVKAPGQILAFDQFHDEGAAVHGI